LGQRGSRSGGHYKKRHQRPCGASQPPSRGLGACGGLRNSIFFEFSGQRQNLGIRSAFCFLHQLHQQYLLLHMFPQTPPRGGRGSKFCRQHRRLLDRQFAGQIGFDPCTEFVDGRQSQAPFSRASTQSHKLFRARDNATLTAPTDHDTRAAMSSIPNRSSE